MERVSEGAARRVPRANAPHPASARKSNCPTSRAKDCLRAMTAAAPRQWRSQRVFPQEHRWKNALTGEQRRHHADESPVQNAVRQAATAAGLAKQATRHTFWHSFTTHRQEDGHDFRTVQELLGHRDVKTTMICAHVLNRGGKGVKSPANDL